MFIKFLYVYLTPSINIEVFTMSYDLGEFYVVKSVSTPTNGDNLLNHYCWLIALAVVLHEIDASVCYYSPYVEGIIFLIKPGQ